MTTSHEPGSPTIVAPQVLLASHLKALKLRTFAREYEKVGWSRRRIAPNSRRYLSWYRSMICDYDLSFGPFHGVSLD